MTILETTTEDRLLSTRQAAEASGLAQAHFNAQISAGNLPATKGEKGRWQIKQSDLDKYLNSRTVKPRRSKAFIEAEAGKPETSLLTQLDEKKKEYDLLQAEHAALKRIIDENAKNHAKELSQVKANADVLLKTNESQIYKIQSLEDENKDLRDQIYELNQYFREILQDVIQSMFGSEKSK